MIATNTFLASLIFESYEIPIAKLSLILPSFEKFLMFPPTTGPFGTIMVSLSGLSNTVVNICTSLTCPDSPCIATTSPTL